MANTFVWYDLMANDRPAMVRYYADVIGWTHEDAPGGMGYTVLKAGDRQVAAIADIPPEAAGMALQWMGYIGTDDVDAKAKVLEGAGAKTLFGPMDIPDVGRLALILDPQGATFDLFTPKPGTEMEPLLYMTPGTVGWHELHTSDWEGAWAFYSGQFGWEQGAQMDMGPDGKYQMYRIGRDQDEGAMWNDKQWPQPAWLFYFAVKGATEAKARIVAGGGTVLMGPHEVPGGMWIVLAKDPQGAMFAVVGPERE